MYCCIAQDGEVGEEKGFMRHATVDIGVGGMSCAGCVASLETALGRAPGVVHVSVNLATERATITYLSTLFRNPR